jgi:hypothetical protein
MEELIFWLVLIVIVVGITIALIVYVILPLSIFLLVGITLGWLCSRLPIPATTASFAAVQIAIRRCPYRSIFARPVSSIILVSGLASMVFSIIAVASVAHRWRP